MEDLRLDSITSTAHHCRLNDQDFRHGCSTQKTETPSASIDGTDLSPTHKPLQMGPLLALCSLLLSIILMFLGLGILLLAQGAIVTGWTAQPPTILAVISAASNACIAFAYSQALPISWWRHAVHARTLKALHHEWAVGKSLIQAARMVKGCRLLALACIATSVVVLDGPLLQKALHVAETIPQDVEQMHIEIAQELPTGSTGTMLPNGDWKTSSEEDDVFQSYLHQRPIVVNVTGCRGSCSGQVHAPGLAAYPGSCAVSNITISGNDLASWPQFVDGKYLMFDVHLLAGYKQFLNWTGPTIPANAVPSILPSEDRSRETVSVFVAYGDAVDGVGTMFLKQCQFVSGVLEYNVTIDRGGSLTLNQAEDNAQPIVALANNTVPFSANATTPSTIGTILKQAEIIFNSRYTFTSSSSRTMDNIVSQSQNLTAFALQHIAVGFPGTFDTTDPMPDIIAALNELMFRGGVAAATSANANYTLARLDAGLPLSQSVAGQRVDYVATFQVQLKWWAAASVLQLVASMLIMPITWGYWRFGRQVSLSPLEVAKAFDGPLLRKAVAKSAASDIAQEIGDMKVRYRMRDYGIVCLEGDNGALLERHETHFRFFYDGENATAAARSQSFL